MNGTIDFNLRNTSVIVEINNSDFPHTMSNADYEAALTNVARQLNKLGANVKSNYRPNRRSFVESFNIQITAGTPAEKLAAAKAKINEISSAGIGNLTLKETAKKIIGG